MSSDIDPFYGNRKNIHEIITGLKKKETVFDRLYQKSMVSIRHSSVNSDKSLTGSS